MDIKEIKDKTYEVVFTNEELHLASDMLGSSYSGGNQWRVSPEDYGGKFGISYEEAHQLFTLLRTHYHERQSDTPISLSEKELRAIMVTTQYMLEKWDEGDFKTIINTNKSDAMVFVQEFEKHGII